MNDRKSLNFFCNAGFKVWQTGGGCTAFVRNAAEERV